MTLTIRPRDKAVISPKIEIKCENDSTFYVCFVEDFRVREFLQTFIVEMDRIIASVPEPFNNVLIHTHIREESHGCLGRVYLLLRQPGCVFDRLLNVFAF